MLVDIVSDLHVDIWNHYTGNTGLDWDKIKNVDSTAIIVAGDTSNQVDLTRFYMQWLSKYYDNVIFIDGNHEHYASKRTVSKGETDLFFGFNSSVNSINYLYEQNLYINGIAFVGLCGWYDFTVGSGMYTEQFFTWKQTSNDPAIIDFGEEGIHNLQQRHSTQLMLRLQEAQTRDEVTKIVVVTHTANNVKHLLFRNFDSQWNKLNGAYANSSIIRIIDKKLYPKITHAISGHTHRRNYLTENSIEFICNPRGYPDEKEGVGWKPLQCRI